MRIFYCAHRDLLTETKRRYALKPLLLYSGVYFGDRLGAPLSSQSACAITESSTHYSLNAAAFGAALYAAFRIKQRHAVATLLLGYETDESAAPPVTLINKVHDESSNQYYFFDMLGASPLLVERSASIKQSTRSSQDAHAQQQSSFANGKLYIAPETLFFFKITEHILQTHQIICAAVNLTALHAATTKMALNALFDLCNRSHTMQTQHALFDNKTCAWIDSCITAWKLSVYEAEEFIELLTALSAQRGALPIADFNTVYSLSAFKQHITRSAQQ